MVMWMVTCNCALRTDKRLRYEEGSATCTQMPLYLINYSDELVDIPHLEQTLSKFVADI